MAPSSKISLKQQLKARKEARDKAKLERDKIKNISIPDKQISLKLSKEQKQEALSKIKSLLLTQATSLVMQQLPVIKKLVKDELGIDIDNPSESSCPANETIRIKVIQSLEKFNNIIGSINKSVLFFDKIKKVTDPVKSFIDQAEKITELLGVTLPLISTAIKAIPIPPGALVGAVDDIDFIRQSLLFTSDGLPKIPILKSSLGSISSVFSIIEGPLSIINDISNQISEFVKKCKIEEIQISRLDPSVSSFLPPIKTIVEDSNPFYKGFNIEIQELPYTSTLTRRRAIGKNQQGIILIQTKPSFTTNSSTLINELKLIIDKSNLKAY